MKYWRLFWKQVCFKHGEEWKIPRQRAKNWRLGVGWGSLKCAINFTDGKVTTKDEMIKNLEKIQNLSLKDCKRNQIPQKKQVEAAAFDDFQFRFIC